jgi:hypothetical protein
MKKIFLAILYALPFVTSFGQNPLTDDGIKLKLQKIKSNFDNLYSTYKTDKQIANQLGNYYTDIKFYNIAGTTSTHNFSEDMSFRIATSDYKSATKANFERAYTELKNILVSVFSDLDKNEEETVSTKTFQLFEKGKNTNVPTKDPNSPKYYIALMFGEEEVESYSVFLYFLYKK